MNQPDAGAVTPPGVLRCALRGLCPRCGRGSLFRNWLTLAPGCTACGLDYSGLGAGDGPAVFAVLIVGFLVAGGTLVLEMTVRPPYWVHAIIWLPMIVILSLLVLRPLKAWLIVQQYRHRAGEHRIGP